MDNTTNSICAKDEEIQTQLEKIAQEEGFQEYKIENVGSSMKGDGYVGIINNFTIEGKDTENKNKTLNLVVKTASKSDAFRSQMPVELVFQREIYMYDTMFPMFQNLEIEKGLEPSTFAPKLYGANAATKSETIIMENLKNDGYKLYERSKTMDHDHVSFVMAQYGRFHAMSLALRDQQPEKFATAMDSLEDFIYKYFREMFFQPMVQRCRTILDMLNPKTEQEAVQKFQKFIDGLWKFMDEIEKENDDYCVVLHGDCWTNNMMFKYEDVNNPTKPTQMRLIDFQISKVGPCLLDLSYFFYACSSKEVINNVKHYMQVYHDSLSAHLRKLGSDPDKVFPYAVFEHQWKKFAKLGLVWAINVLQVMLSEKDEVIDFKDAAESGKNILEALDFKIAKQEEYNDRIRHIVLHLVENDFI